MLGQEAPNFSAMSSQGDINWHDWIEGSWTVLCSHPADFTPVCTSELAALTGLHEEFAKRRTKVAALSCNSVDLHQLWIPDIESMEMARGQAVQFPIIADPYKAIATMYGMIERGAGGDREAGLPAHSCRGVFFIDPQKRLSASFLYPGTTGRDFTEVLRVLDSLQICASHKVATPAGWNNGDTLFVHPDVTDEKADADFKRRGFRGIFRKRKGFSVEAVPSGARYLRETDIPDGHRRNNRADIKKHLAHMVFPTLLILAGAVSERFLQVLRF